MQQQGEGWEGEKHQLLILTHMRRLHPPFATCCHTLYSNPTPPKKYYDAAATTLSVTQTGSLVKSVFASGETIGRPRKQAGGRKRQLGGDVAAEFRAGLSTTRQDWRLAR